MHETAEDLAYLQRALDESYAAAGEHLRSIFVPDQRSSAEDLVARLTGVFLINLAFRSHLEDTQCGFKAVSNECARKLLPFVQDTGWFWDTELLLLAAKGGWRIAFVPVRWIEDADTRVKVASTVWRDLKGLLRMRKFDWSKARKT